MIKIDKIKLQNFRFFIDDDVNNTFVTNGKSVLIYGENGSGKSSLYKAFEFLSTPSIPLDKFNENKNIFQEVNDTYLEFDFSNSETLRIDEDHLNLDGNYNFIEKLSISKPLLDYKSLLKVTYDEQYQNASVAEKKNLFTFFESLLQDYPIESSQTLKDIKGDGEAYFGRFKTILKDEIFDDINHFLNFFDHNIKITDIKFDAFNKKTTLESHLQISPSNLPKISIDFGI